MLSKIIFLTGAPTSRSLRWDEDELLDAPVPPFGAQDGHHEDSSMSLNSHPVKWRLLQDAEARGQIFEDTALDRRETLFFTTRDLATSSTPMSTTTTHDDSDLSQFYDHSFAVHETSTISASGIFPGDSMRESGLWADSTGTSIETASFGDPSSLSFLQLQGPLSDLEDIPNARYLRSIVPQTMTVNLIVGIIAVHPPRRVMTRQWKKELDIVELVVGDETRTGFGVTFWLSPADDDDGLGKTLSGLRPRDIVLLRTVALSSFRERVYGQSLRKGTTKIDLLHRQPVDSTDTGGILSLRTINAATKDDRLLLKVRKVREWVLRFVGYPTDGAGGNRGMRRHHPAQKDQMLPPDTQ